MNKEERKCRVCGCTQNNACPGNCYWVEEDLCSRCAVCHVCGESGHDNIYTCDLCGNYFCDDCGVPGIEGNTCNKCLEGMDKCDCTKCEFRDTEDCPMEGYNFVYDCPEYRMTQLNKLINEAHSNAVDHGWWEKPKSIGELLALIHSEVSECLEEYRNGHKPTETYYSKKIPLSIHNSGTPIEQVPLKVDEIHFFKNNSDNLKPEGIPSELADVVIRVFDMCGYFGIDLEAAIKEKMAYNKSRPYKHGGKKL